MSEVIQHFRDWCIAQHEELSKSLELMEKGQVRTSEQRAGSGAVDTTDASIARTKQSLADLEKVLQMMRDDASGQGDSRSGA